MEILAKIIDWVRTNKGDLDQTIEITADSELLRDGLIDSLDLLQLVAYIEDQFKINLPPDALTPDNFSTPQAISNLIGQVRASSS